MSIARTLPVAAGLCWLLAAAALAQTAPPAAGGAAGSPAAQEEGTAPASLDDLIATLENPEAREAFLARLKALQAGAAPEPERGAFAGTIDAIADAIEARVDTAGEAFAGMVGSLRQVPILARWVWLQLSEPISRALWWSVTVESGGAVLAGVLASLAVRLPLRRWRDRIGTLPLAAPARARLKASLAFLAVDLAALLSFLLVTYGVLAFGAGTPLTRAVATDILVAIGWWRGLTALSRALLAPENPRRRLPQIGDALARRLQGWFSFLLGLAVLGDYLLRAAQRLGLPWTVHGFLRHLLFLAVAVLAIVQIYRFRGEIAALVEHWGRSSTSALTRYLPWRALAATGHHVLAAWIAVVYLVWALGVRDGAVLLTRGLTVTLVALFLLRLFHLWAERTFRPRPPAAAEEGGEPEPEPQPASGAALVAGLRAAAGLLALAVVLQAWGVDVAGWMQSAPGRAVLASLARIGIVVAIVVLVARAVQAGAARYVQATDEAGQPLYSNRTRTLVSMARNVVLTLVAAIGAVEVLTELGVNTGALLAGAGVVGLAVGFGSQKLVQDLINGLFILLGDTIRVGDVVDLGGRSGVVEAISMRTVTLRDYNGNVHTIPYSSIDVVTNMTKDFSFAVFDVTVAYKEDADQVMEVLRGIDSQLRREWPYRRLILEPIEIAGVDAFRESGVLIKARSKVRPGEQWKVAREFNRRLKLRFEELGIEIPFPHQTIYFGTGKDGAAPPLHVETVRPERPPARPPAPRAVGES